MTLFDKLEFSRRHMGGGSRSRAVMEFDNGFVAIVLNSGRYRDSYEFLVAYNNAPHYKNPVCRGDHVRGYRRREQIDALLEQVKGFDPLLPFY